MTRGLAAEQAPGSAAGDAGGKRLDRAEPEKPPERLKWHLWHGNRERRRDSAAGPRELVLTQILNGDLRASFHRRYAGLQAAPEPVEEEAA